MIDINTCLMFYRDWILEKEYLKTDSTWFTYCAAHKTLVTTVALNLPHNRQSFMEVYGATEGSDFYDLFCKNYFDLAGEEFTPDLETYFVPLWQKEGLSPDQIKPFTMRNIPHTTLQDGQELWRISQASNPLSQHRPQDGDRNFQPI